MKKCSVIICTHNRASSLENTLRCLFLQKTEEIDMEIIVVDNGSTDDTKQRIKDLIPFSPCSLKYVFEPEIGLSKARNTGTQNAHGDILFFFGR